MKGENEEKRRNVEHQKAQVTGEIFYFCVHLVAIVDTSDRPASVDQ